MNAVHKEQTSQTVSLQKQSFWLIKLVVLGILLENMIISRAT